MTMKKKPVANHPTFAVLVNDFKVPWNKTSKDVPIPHKASPFASFLSVRHDSLGTGSKRGSFFSV